MAIEAEREVEPTAAPSEGARRRLWPAALGCALVAIALTAWVTWSTLSSAAVDGVRVTYDAQPLACEGSEVGTVPGSANPTFLQPVAALTPGMRCELRIQVVNDGPARVTVTTVGLLGLSEGNPLGIEPAFVNPNGQLRLDDVDGVAAFAIEGGVAIAPGGSATFTAVLAYDGGAQLVECSAQGMNVPVVTVTARGATRDVQPAPENLVWFQAGSLADCP